MLINVNIIHKMHLLYRINISSCSSTKINDDNKTKKKQSESRWQADRETTANECHQNYVKCSSYRQWCQQATQWQMLLSTSLLTNKTFHMKRARNTWPESYRDSAEYEMHAVQWTSSHWSGSSKLCSLQLLSKTPAPVKISEPAKTLNAENRFVASVSSAPSSGHRHRQTQLHVKSSHTHRILCGWFI